MEDDDDDDSRIESHQISPPPTPINRFLKSVDNYKKNQIKVSLPLFTLRGLGRNAYHVFEVKVCHSQDFLYLFIFYLVENLLLQSNLVTFNLGNH